MSISHFGHGDALFPATQKTIDPDTGELLPHADAEHRTRSVFERRGGAQPVGAADAELPVSNTGVHASLGRAAVSLDYLTVVPHCEIELVLPILELVGLGAVDKLDGGSRFCQEVYTGLHGLRIEAKPRAENQQFCVVTLPGECCQWLGVDGCQKLQFAFWMLRDDTGCKVNVTRIDVAIDTQAFPARWVASALRSGAIDRRSEAFDVHESDGDGCTVYLGSETSDKRWRVYHKTDGATFGVGVAFTRVEQQFRREAAQAVYDRLAVTMVEAWGAVAAELLNDYAQIAKRWWRAFVGTVRVAALVLHRTRSTIEKQRRWLEKQVAPTLALVVDALGVFGAGRGREFLEALLIDGRERRSVVGARRVSANEPDGLPRLAVTFGGAL